MQEQTEGQGHFPQSDPLHQPPSSPDPGSCKWSSINTSTTSYYTPHQHSLSSSTLLKISPGSHGVAAHDAQEGDDDNVPPISMVNVGGGLASISLSQPVLCSLPPHNSDYSHLLSSAPTSTHSLLMATCPYPNLQPSAEPTLPHSAPALSELNLSTAVTHSDQNIPDTSSLLDEDSEDCVHLADHSPPPLILDSASVNVPLGNLSSVGHTSRECLLAEQGSVESQDSEMSESRSRRSSTGTQSQTQGSETSWCLDLMD